MGNPKWQAPLLGSDVRLKTSIVAGESESDGIEFDIRGFFGLIRRQSRLIFATIFFICTIAGLILFQLTPIYSASSLIIVDTRQQSILDPDGQMSLAPSDQGRVESEVEILRSPSVFLTVVRDLELFRDEEFGPRPGLREKIGALLGFEAIVPTADETLKLTLDALQNATSISRVGVTYLINVTVRSQDPDKAARIANAIANAYVQEQVGSKIEMVIGIQEALLGRLNEASATLRQAEVNLDGFIVDNIDNVADDNSQRDLVDLRNRMLTSQAENTRLSQQLSAAESGLTRRDWQGLVETIDAVALRQLYDQREEISEALRQSNIDAQEGFDLRASLAQIDSDLEAEARSGISRLQSARDVIQATEQDLRQQLRTRVVESELPRDKLVQLYEIQQAANISRSVYQDLLNRSKVIESQRNIQVPDARVVAQALPPSNPSFPKKKLVLGVAGAFSLLLGLGLAFVREHYVGGFMSELQAEQVLRVPVVSSLPRLTKSGSGSGSEYPAEVVENPLSTYSEAVRRARLAVEFGSRGGDGGGGRVIMITSALPGEGKTQTAVSIARSLSMSGKRTLLIDCDLRRPRVHSAMDMALGDELTNYLLAGSNLAPADIIGRDHLTDLSVVLGLRNTRLAVSDLPFEGQAFASLIAYARDKYDYVLLDSSPTLPVVDPRLLLRHADAVLVVVKWASTAQREVSAAVNDLERANNRNVPIVIVLNQVATGAGGYGAASGYYTSYQGQDA